MSIDEKIRFSGQSEKLDIITVYGNVSKDKTTTSHNKGIMKNRLSRQSGKWNLTTPKSKLVKIKAVFILKGFVINNQDFSPWD